MQDDLYICVFKSGEEGLHTPRRVFKTRAKCLSGGNVVFGDIKLGRRLRLFRGTVLFLEHPAGLLHFQQVNP